MVKFSFHKTFLSKTTFLHFLRLSHRGTCGSPILSKMQVPGSFNKRKISSPQWDTIKSARVDLEKNGEKLSAINDFLKCVIVAFHTVFTSRVALNGFPKKMF